MRRSGLWSGVVARRDVRGAAAVEFALIMPILLILVFGIISYGYMLSFRQAISQGAAEGARAAAVSQDPGSQESDAIDALNEALDSYGVTCAGPDGPLRRNDATVGTCGVEVGACDNDASADCAEVSVNYDYDANPLLPVPLVGIALPDNLSYTAVARVS
ncbi:hypothetical protein GCM10025786_01380 [Nocardioides caeni]